MKQLTPSFLLDNPSLVQPIAPWCIPLESHELGILLMAQPWVVGSGVRRADLEKQLSEMFRDFISKPIYFQMVKRSVEKLEQCGSLKGLGKGRNRKFVLTPEGFAALIINIQVVRADPTIDGSEFEFKRELVAMWNIMMDRIVETPLEFSIPQAIVDFFKVIDEIRIWNQPVITVDVMKDAFNVQKLITGQRESLNMELQKLESSLENAKIQADYLKNVDFSQLDLTSLGKDLLSILKGNPDLLRIIIKLSTTAMPQISIQGKIVRYHQYIKYMDALSEMYQKELKIVDINILRQRIAAGGG